MLAHLSILLPCHLQEPHLTSTCHMKMSPVGRIFLPQRWHSLCTAFRCSWKTERSEISASSSLSCSPTGFWDQRGSCISCSLFSAGSESPSGTGRFPAPGKHEYGSMLLFFLSFPLSLPWACSVLTSAASRAANTNKDLSKWKLQSVFRLNANKMFSETALFRSLIFPFLI